LSQAAPACCAPRAAPLLKTSLWTQCVQKSAGKEVNKMVRVLRMTLLVATTATAVASTILIIVQVAAATAHAFQ
jgi:hypothetical protein